MKKNILAIDTSTAKNLVFHLSTKDHTIAQTVLLDHMESELLQTLDKAFQEAHIQPQNIDHFIIGAGPGSFMGLRLGFSVIRTWAWLFKKPLHTISSLDLLARPIISDSKHPILVPCIDGKMQRVFCNIFENRQKVLEDSDLLPEDLVRKLQKYNPDNIIIVGSGAAVIKKILPETHTEEDRKISHSAFHREYLEELINKPAPDFDKALPNYIRISAAEMNLKNKTS